MSYIIRKPWSRNYLVHCNQVTHATGGVALDFMWFHKEGSAYQFEEKASADTIAFLVNGIVEEKQ